MQPLAHPTPTSGLLPRRVAWFVAVVHAGGLVGMLLPPTRTYFVALTPLSLLFTAAVLVWFHVWSPRAASSFEAALRRPSRAFWVFAAGTFAAGWSVEWLGVHTGWIFGDYAYGGTLGLKVDGIPLMIGVNWFILVYAVGTLLHRLPWPNVARAALGATVMTALDVLIEPTAIAYDYWAWAGGAVPLRNYVGWWAVAFALLLWFGRTRFPKGNPLAGPVLAAQAGFFLLHALLGP
ncbi:MAG: carotenoid biosynthesis protein [Catalinimonas sp.]